MKNVVHHALIWATLFTCPLVASAQARTAQRTAPPAPGQPGDMLEDRLMATLASREMDGLLEHYFKKHNVPPQKQAAIKGIVALRQLSDANVPAGRKRTLLRDAVKGVDQFIATTRDTEALLLRALLFIEHGMKGQIDQITYLGESPARQAELNEAAEAVFKLFEKAVEECEAQQAKLLAGQTRPSDALLKQWQVLEDRANTAKWNRALASFGLALSLDPANPRRKEVADAALTYLKDFEAPEFEKQHAAVKMQLAKLNMVKGDYLAAIAKFAEAQTSPGIGKFETYEAL